MKIALVTLSFLPVRGGMEFVVHDLASALQSGGHDVTVFAPARRDKAEEEPHDYTLVRFGWTFRGAYRLGFNKWPLRKAFSRRHAERPFDVINSHSAYLATSYAHSLGDRFNLPVLVTCHGADIQREAEVGYGLRLTPKNDRIIRTNLEKASAVVSISPSTYTELDQLLPAENIISIPMGIWPSGNFLNAAPWLRSSVDAAVDDIIVISVGRNDFRKSFGLGVQAFALALQTAPSLRYIHIGRGGDQLESTASELGIADRFHAIGEMPRSAVINAYHEADIFFSPASVESFGIVTFEAMAAGLPVVVTDGPGNRDAVDSGVEGYVVPVSDTQAMASALVRLALDPTEQATLGQNAKLKGQSYTWPEIAKQYADAMSRL